MFCKDEKTGAIFKIPTSRRDVENFDTFGITDSRRFSMLNLSFPRIFTSLVYLYLGSTCSEPQKEKRSPKPKHLERSHSGLNFFSNLL